MGVTTKVKELRESMIGAINNAQLPACIVLLVMESLTAELKTQEAMQLQMEAQEEEEAHNERSD